MEKGRLYIPDRSILYYCAVLLAFIGTAALIWCNIYCFDAANSGFAYSRINYMDHIRPEWWIYIVGALQLLTDLSIPVAYILAKKELKYACIFGIGGIVFNAFLALAALIQVALTFIGDFLGAFNVTSMDYFMTVLFFLPLFLLAAVIMLSFAVVAAVMIAIIKGFPYAVSGLTYALEYEKALRSKKLGIIVNTVSMLLIPFSEIFMCRLLEEHDLMYTISDRLWWLFVPYLIHALAALLFGLSMKNLPPETPERKTPEDNTAEPAPTATDSMIPKLIDR